MVSVNDIFRGPDASEIGFFSLKHYLWVLEAVKKIEKMIKMSSSFIFFVILYIIILIDDKLEIFIEFCNNLLYFKLKYYKKYNNFNLQKFLEFFYHKE